MALVSSESRQPGLKAMQRRLTLAGLGVFLFFTLLVIRIYNLQIVRGDELKIRGRRNFVQQKPILHDRGIIYDRNGKILVDNRLSLQMQLTPAFMGSKKEQKETFKSLNRILNLGSAERDEIETKIKKKRGLERFQPIVIRRDLGPAQVDAVESERSIFRLNGVDIVEGRRRAYKYGTLAAHLLGYVNEIGKGRLRRERNSGNPLHYKMGDLLGRDGIEKTLEKELRGTDGTEKMVVDAKGRRQQGEYVQQLLGEGSRVDPVPGHSVYLTIDLELQKKAEEAFTGRAGAVVALDPRDGAILAIASFPGFDPNMVSGALAPDEKRRLDLHPLKPWINRTISGQYAPGSTYKIVTALAALREDETTANENVFCPGYYRIGRHTWRCWKESGHGHLALKGALKGSCDTYFYTMGARVGIDAMAKAARVLGFDKRTGIRLRNEKPGIAPDEAFHDRVDKSTGGYQKGMAVNTSIGQGSVLVTPLQLALAYATIANGGELLAPQIIYRIASADHRIQRCRLEHDEEGAEFIEEEMLEGAPPQELQPFVRKVKHKLEISPEKLASIHEGLVAVTSEAGGTGYRRRSRIVTMAGKTGTAQVVRLGKHRERASEMDYFSRDHAWFASYAPIEDPEIVVVVLNEHSGHGGSQAAPIAVAVIDRYFELKALRSGSQSPQP
ncbi:penicillin-binding protein 2 [Myxococcota bacterium]|nr:penicillin-binding protein 2 [Myxococcota bacterium]